jgi:hypothetical protein
MKPPAHPPDDRGIALGHEPTDFDPRGLLLFAGVLFATLVVTGALVWWLLDTFAQEADRDEPPPSPFVQEQQNFPEPRLERVSTEEITNLRARENELLNTSAWIDRERNIARIPIDRAIEIVTKDGLPQWPAPPSEQPAVTAEEQP